MIAFRGRVAMTITSAFCVFILCLFPVVKAYLSPDCASMEAIKTALHFPKDTDWSKLDCCSWKGIICDEHSRVINLRLSGSGVSGYISPEIKYLRSLRVFELVDTRITGVVPPALTQLSSLRVVNMTNNLLQGPTPEFDAQVQVDIRIGTNSFCLTSPGVACDPRVTTLLSVIENFGYPIGFAMIWKGNDPCHDWWFGIQCLRDGNIHSIVFRNRDLIGTISPWFANLTSLAVIDLSRNRLTGTIPVELTRLKNLKVLDVSDNKLHGKVPYFQGLKVKAGGNPDLETKMHKKSSVLTVFLGIMVVFLVIGGACLGFYIVIKMKRSRLRGSTVTTQPSVVQNEVEVFAIEVLRDATSGFGDANIVGRGGFGAVYKGRLPNGTEIAVKRMERCEKGNDEFMSEVSVLTKVHHCNLVILHGYCLDGNEKLLVYQYMAQGTLSRHLFHWNDEKLRPLEWSRRLSIALDVARGLEYLHTLARQSQSYIHRDLKPSNILLGDDMRAKISDFGLVRSTVQGKESFQTKCVGTHGYIAPEYPMIGRVTRKIDVYSFGIILMELITGQKAVDDTRPEEDLHITSLFKRNKNSLTNIIDKTIEVSEDLEDSINEVGQLAIHCIAKEPEQRPEMSHAVRVLSSLTAGEWKPVEEVEEEEHRVDTPLLEILSRWQEQETGDIELDEITVV